jgi:hypothetical protein
MQQACNPMTAPADTAKTVLDELQRFNPSNAPKYSFWYFIGIVLVMICCFAYFHSELEISKGDSSD